MTNMTSSLHRAVQQRPNEVATLYRDRTKTWSEIFDRVTRYASVLKRSGVEEEDRVAILALNSDLYFEYYLAVRWAGAAVVPLNTRWAVPEIAYAIRDSECKLLIDDAFLALAGELRRECSTLEEILYVGDDIGDHIGDNEAPEGIADLNGLMNEVSGMQEAHRTGSDLFGIFYTSGTTAQPKGVMLSHQNVWCSAVAVGAELQIVCDDVYLHCAPIFHLADGVHGFAANLFSASHAFVEAFDPDSLLDVIEQKRVTHTLLVPTMIAALLANPRIRSVDLASLKAIIYGASPMTEDLLHKAIEILPSVGFYQDYGQTEMAPTISILGPENHIQDGPLSHRSRSVGRSALGIRVKVAGDDGCEVKRGDVAEVWAQGANVMLGYLGRPEETARTLVDGWIRTGDAGYMD